MDLSDTLALGGRPTFARPHRPGRRGGALRWRRYRAMGSEKTPFSFTCPLNVVSNRGRYANRTWITAKGEIRTQYAHAIDMVPTVLDREA